MLEAKTYVPLLRTKVAEVEAFRTLSAEAKALSFPIFLSRPWQNATYFDFTIDKLKTAAAGHPFALGLDSEKFGASSTKPAQLEFEELFQPQLGFRSYYDFLVNIETAIPVFIPTNQAQTLIRQLGNAEDLDRGLVVLLRREAPIPMTETVLSLSPCLTIQFSLLMQVGREIH